MNRLRTDVQLMNQSDLEAWIEDLCNHMHKADIEDIHRQLTLRIKLDDQAIQLGKKFKVCDKCHSTFPLHTNTCDQCGYEKLRIFGRQ